MSGRGQLCVRRATLLMNCMCYAVAPVPIFAAAKRPRQALLAYQNDYTYDSCTEPEQLPPGSVSTFFGL